MQVSFPPLVDNAEILHLVGDTSFKRGRTYARKEAVFDVDSVPDALEIRGKVLGNRATPYKTKVHFVLANSGVRPHRGTCSCPMRYDCKHVAALLLTSNRDLAPRAEEAAAAGQTARAIDYASVMTDAPNMLPDMPEIKPALLQKKLAAAAAQKQARKPRRVSAPVRAAEQPSRWKEQLRSLLEPDRTYTAYQGYIGHLQQHRTGSPTPLGVQLELQEAPQQYRTRHQPGRSDPWQGETSPALKLTARPVKRSTTGNWVVAQLRWDTFNRSYYGPSAGEFDESQVRWMRTFAAVYSSAGQHQAADAFLHVENFNSPLLWDLLAKATESGVQLVGAKAGNAVVIHPPVPVSLDMRGGDGLQLVPRAEAGGRSLDPSALGLIGKPGHGLFWWDGGGPGTSSAAVTINLAPTAAPVPDTVRPLIMHRTSLRIPESARDAFLGTHFPQLAQTTELVSSDGSVDLPEIVPPLLVLTAAHLPEENPTVRSRGKTQPGVAPQDPGLLHLHWHWEYTSAGTITVHSMADGATGYRDRTFESHLLADVAEALTPFPTAWQEQFPDALTGHPGSSMPAVLRRVAAARFTTEALPLLEEFEQVRVDTTGQMPDYVELTETPRIAVSTTATNDGDWFDLGVSVTLGGTEVPFDQLFRALAAGEEHLMLPNGNYFRLDQPEFLQLRRLIEEARSLQDKDEGLRISRYQAGLWDELEELAATAEQAETWRRSVSGLLNISEVSAVPVPAGLDASLRPYQQDGFNWLAFLWEHGLGGVLADDMGLGKTLQTIALLCHARGHGETRPFLVVAPTSVVPNWAAEIRRFAPGLRVTAVTDTLRRSGSEAADIAGSANVVVLSYALFRLDYEAYSALDWAGLLLDEAQFVKNPATKASQNARAFPAPFKLAITGTPMENNLMELWSMFAITAPGLFASSKNFAEYYQKPVEKESDNERLAQLRRRIRPLMMRRSKELVAKELPAKQEQVLELELTPRHRTVYQRHLQRERQKVLGMLHDMDRNRFAIFKSLTTLRMLSLDASLLDEKYAAVPSSKLDALLEQLGDIVTEGHRALIFSQFTGFLSKAAERLEAEGIEFAYLDGKTRRRGEVIDGFKSGEAPVFLISLKAGGFGLNLTEADYCFLLDPWWNPASENQAVDRTHRIGQTKNVMVYRMVAKDTIEEKVMALKEKKARLFTAVLDDDAAFSSALSAEDVRGLFEH